jgi:PTS system mannose-specific IIA component
MMVHLFFCQKGVFVFDVIIISHGGYAQAMLESAEMIMGKQENVKTMGLFPGDSVDIFRENLFRLIRESITGDGLLLLSDTKSGSPFNCAVAAMDDMQFCHITGISLPLLLEVFGNRKKKSPEQVRDIIFELASYTLVDVNKFLEGI